MILLIALLHQAPITADVGAQPATGRGGGRRLLSFRSERSAACIVEWDLVAQRLAAEAHRRIDL